MKTKTKKDTNITLRVDIQDYDNITKIAESMNLNLSNLVRLSLEPYLIKDRLKNSEHKTKEKKLSGLAGLLETKKVLEYYEGELGMLLKDVKDKIRNIQDAEKYIQDLYGNNQIDLSFAKVKQHF